MKKIKLTCNGVTLHEREIAIYKPPMEFILWRGRTFILSPRSTEDALEYEERLTLKLD